MQLLSHYNETPIPHKQFDQSSPHGPKPNEVAQGQLKVQDSSSQNWKWRYCCLKDTCLAFFANPDDCNAFQKADVCDESLGKADGYIYLTQTARVEMRLDCGHDETSSQFTIFLEETPKQLNFAGHSDEECEYWCNAINAQITGRASPGFGEELDDTEMSDMPKEDQAGLDGLAPDCDVYHETFQCIEYNFVEPMLAQIKENEAKLKELTDSLPSDINGSHYVKDPHCCSSQYQKDFADSGVAFALTHVDGRFLDCNVALEEMTGFTRSELLETNVFAITVPSDLPKMFNCLQAMADGRYCVCKTEKRWVNKGQIFRVCCMVSVVVDNKQSPDFIAWFGPPKTDDDSVMHGTSEILESPTMQDTSKMQES